MNLAEKRRENLVQAGLDQTGLYHSIRLPDGRILQGAMSMEWQEARLASFGLPEDLRGKTVLDIGPWDGFYTFEMERRGAEVTAIDYADLDTFRALHRALHSRARYERLDVYELDPKRIGTFDIVLCLGTLYHFKHPLLALEKICAVTRDICIVDTFVTDGETRREGIRPHVPYIEFYERDELSGQYDNWCGPSVCAVEALVRSAGFARAEMLRVSEASACVAAHRKWRNLPPDKDPPAGLLGLSSHASRGRTFFSNKEEYLVFWCAWTDDNAPPLDEIFPEIDGLGAAPIGCARVIEGILVNVRTPPGLAPGRHEARIKIERSAWSDRREFFLDLPDVTSEIQILSVQDGATWKIGEVDWTHGGWMTVWVAGLTPEADAANTAVEVAGVPHSPHAVHPSKGQVNVQLRPLLCAGEYEAVVIHRNARTSGASVKVIGEPPPIRGLETI